MTEAHCNPKNSALLPGRKKMTATAAPADCPAIDFDHLVPCLIGASIKTRHEEAVSASHTASP